MVVTDTDDDDALEPDNIVNHKAQHQAASAAGHQLAPHRSSSATRYQNNDHQNGNADNDTDDVADDTDATTRALASPSSSMSQVPPTRPHRPGFRNVSRKYPTLHEVVVCDCTTHALVPSRVTCSPLTYSPLIALSVSVYLSICLSVYLSPTQECGCASCHSTSIVCARCVWFVSQ
jgi:hypothetical protein